MLCFLCHERLGGGANLSVTCLYLTLLHMVQHELPVGRSLMVLLDNTTAENKCNEMMFFISWLVAQGKPDNETCSNVLTISHPHALSPTHPLTPLSHPQTLC